MDNNLQIVPKFVRNNINERIKEHTADTYVLHINPFKTKKNLIIFERSRSYRAVNTPRLGYNNQPLNIVQENNRRFGNHEKHINTPRGQNVEFFSVKPGRTERNHRDFRS
jgi:hypothetical protein